REYVVVRIGGAGPVGLEPRRRVVDPDLDGPVLRDVETGIDGIGMAGQDQRRAAGVREQVGGGACAVLGISPEDDDDTGSAHRDSARRLSSFSASPRIRRSARLRRLPITGTVSSISSS